MRLSLTRSWKRTADLRRFPPIVLDPAEASRRAKAMKPKPPTYCCPTCGRDLGDTIGTARCPNDTPEWPHDNRRPSGGAPPPATTERSGR